MDIIYMKLEEDDIQQNFLTGFNRYQNVKKCWRKENGNWILKDIAFIEQWDDKEKSNVIKDLRRIISEGGAVYGAFESDRLVGFSAIEGELIGSRKQYTVLHYIYTSHDYRGNGIGKMLFVKACEFAVALGAKKLYISAHSSEESQAFY